MCNAWKDWSVKNLKIEKFLVLIDRTSIEYRSKRQGVLNTKAHIFNQSREIFDWSKQLKFLKLWNLKILCKKTTWRDVFKTQCIWSRKVLKTWCLLNANIKTNQEVKNKDFKLLNRFFFKFPTKNKNLYLHISSYAIKDGQISWHTIICIEFSKDLCVVCATSMCMRYIRGDI